MNNNERYEQLKQLGKQFYLSIVEMVSVLESDYDRLEELHEEMETWVENEGGDPDEQDRTREDWIREFPDEAKEMMEIENTVADCKDKEQAEQRIQEDALSVRVFGERVEGEWQADKFELLLATGGPAVRIMGELDDNCEPSRAWLETQDWGMPWTQYYEPGIQETLLSYSRCFYFGE